MKKQAQVMFNHLGEGALLKYYEETESDSNSAMRMVQEDTVATLFPLHLLL